MSNEANEFKEYEKARKLIDGVVEPQIEKVIQELNKILKTYGIAAAATINWEFIPLDKKKEIQNESS